MFSIPRKKLIKLLAAVFILATVVLYGGGFLAQFLYNYDVWQEAGAQFGTAPQLPDANFIACLAAVFRWPSGLYGLGLCIGGLAALVLGIMCMGRGEGGELDKDRNLVYQLLAMSSEKELNALFDVLPVTHPAKAPYSIFKQSSESVRGGVIIGLGSRLQVFQNQDIRNITGYDEIDLELPGKQPCAYFCITSDQDSTFDFLSSLFLSFIFIKLVRFADQKCPGGALPVLSHDYETGFRDG